MSGTYEITDPNTGEVKIVDVQTVKNTFLTNIFAKIQGMKYKAIKQYNKILSKKNFIVTYEDEMKQYKIVKCLIYNFKNNVIEDITKLIAKKNHADGYLNVEAIRDKLKNKQIISDYLAILAIFYQDVSDETKTVKCVNVDINNNVYVDDKSHIMFNIIDLTR
jgi:hypothetical protein